MKALKMIAALMRQGRKEIPEPAAEGEWFDSFSEYSRGELGQFADIVPPTACSMGCVVWAARQYVRFCTTTDEIDDIMEEMGLPQYVHGSDLIKAGLPEGVDEYFDDRGFWYNASYDDDYRLLYFIGTTLNDTYKIPTMEIADYLERLADVLNGDEA